MKISSERLKTKFEMTLQSTIFRMKISSERLKTLILLFIIILGGLIFLLSPGY